MKYLEVNFEFSCFLLNEEYKLIDLIKKIQVCEIFKIKKYLLYFEFILWCMHELDISNLNPLSTKLNNIIITSSKHSSSQPISSFKH